MVEKMKKDLFIIGAGSVGGHIASNFAAYSQDYRLCGFFDDDAEKIGSFHFGYQVLGFINDVLNVQNAAVILGIAFPCIKKIIADKLSANDSLTYPSLIHKRAWVSEDVDVGIGCIIYPGTSINYGSTIGNFVVLNMNCALGHHTNVGNFSSFAPGVNTGGCTTIEHEVDVGIGASTIQNIRIGFNSVVGGKSMLISDVPSKTTVAGVPARVIKSENMLKASQG